MAEPKIADTKPNVVELEPGTYWWCSCGLSQNQPYCDGSHKGSEFSPVKIVQEENKHVAFCMCKHSANGAFCDGAHKSLD